MCRRVLRHSLKSVNRHSKADETQQDYAFRYRLDLESAKTPVFHHRLAELVRAVLESLLNVVVPQSSGKDVKVDGFRWLMDREQNYPLFCNLDKASAPSAFGAPRGNRLLEPENGDGAVFQSVANASLYEPRIDLIAKLTESILALVGFEYQGKPVEVDGFKLKDLHDWIVPSTGSTGEVIDYAGSSCSCDCVFCCNRGNPPSVAVSNGMSRAAEEDFAEIKTRIEYFSPENGLALFPSLGSVYEVTTHPFFLAMLRRLRAKTSRPFRITTNGNNLTPKVVAEMSELKPVYLYFSLNSSSPSRRQRLMRDSNSQTAIDALPLLKEHLIPYAAVIVPWPLDTMSEMLDDLSATVAYAASQEANMIQVNLPGYTRCFSPIPEVDFHRVWEAVIEQVRELREKHDCPIVAMPTLYEENIYHKSKNLAQIIGVVKNSPAYFGDLRKGDIILDISGFPVRSRPQARDLLSALRQSQANALSLKVQRGTSTVQINLDLSKHSYPYSPDFDAYLGMVFLGAGFRVSYLEDLKQVIEARRARRVLFLSSELVKPSLEQCLAETRLFTNSAAKIDIEVPQNRFFGGNIFMGDLLVVQDFIDHIQGYVARRGFKPDLVVIPSSPFNLSGWGRDLTGRVYLDIERVTGVPVELLPCATVYE
ncbi:MAG: radical SAM protein [Chloroflexi bacterium]|nr:radical SAM protein [Chloroflexota bacterium]MBM3172603.1 radical SAM protein [Chloroflexota bacterium]MBM3174607.1 radical SAM protein [Chloroflexota bacterium]MBM4449536.1 radical SAM protein [Chloroflexota bacterium]